MTHEALTRRAPRGFTLVELLVVLGILSLLVTAFYPMITNAMGQSEVTATRSRLIALQSAVEGFEGRYGMYPPDDFGAAIDELDLQAKPDNKTNTGIEALVAYLSWKNVGAVDLGEHLDWLDNTDGDSHGTRNPGLGRTSRDELVDAWGVPFVYFNISSGVTKQTIRLPDMHGGDTATCLANKDPRGDRLLGKYQLISAGEDNVFNTDDDICYPELPR